MYFGFCDFVDGWKRSTVHGFEGNKVLDLLMTEAFRVNIVIRKTCKGLITLQHSYPGR